MKPKIRRRWLIAIALLILLFGVFKTNTYEIKRESEGIVPVQDKSPVAWQITPIMEKLAMCESSNNHLAINPHDGGSPSFGLYQYKRGTWEYFVRKYDLFPVAEAAELENLIMDREAQELVTWNVLKNPKTYVHWRNCLGYLLK